MAHSPRVRVTGRRAPAWISPGEFPERLSEWHLLEQRDGKLAPNDGVTPYDLNSPLFSDYAHKLRTVVLPRRYEHPLRRGCVRVSRRHGDFEDLLLSARRFNSGRRVAVRKVLAQAPGASLDLDAGSLAGDAPADQHGVGLGRDPLRLECRADGSDAGPRRRHVVAGAGERPGSSAVPVSRAGHESVRGLSRSRAQVAEDRADRHPRAPPQQVVPLRRAERESAGTLAEDRTCVRRAGFGARAAQRALGRSRRH